MPPIWKEIVGNYGQAAQRLLKNPTTYIIGAVVEWFTGLLTDLLRSALGLISQAFGLVADVPVLVADSAISALQPAGAAILSLLGALWAPLGTLIGVSGPFGPIIAAVLIVVAVNGLQRAGWVSLEVISPRVAAVVRALLPWRWF